MDLQLFVGPWTFFFFSYVILYTIGTTHGMADPPVERPLPTHRGEGGKNIYTHTQIAMHREGFETVKRVKRVRPTSKYFSERQ
jgi:hypothetical protein